MKLSKGAANITLKISKKQMIEHKFYCNAKKINEF